MRSFFLFLLTAVFIAGFGLAAHAQDNGVVSAGSPTVFHVDPGQFIYSDIYARQIEYKHNRDAFIQELKVRQANYPVPRRIAIENYKANLDKVYEEEHQKEVQLKLEEEEAERAANAPPETYGPPTPPSADL